MPKLVKNKTIVDDEWQVLAEGEIASSESTNVLLALANFLTLAEAGNIDFSRQGCWLKSVDDTEQLAPYIKELTVIGLVFETFTDGRSFSQARTLRDHLDYVGELRAIGYFLQDQMFYLRRCGVDAFVVADDANLDSIVTSLGDFTEKYQAACDEPQPLFRRRV